MSDSAGNTTIDALNSDSTREVEAIPLLHEHYQGFRYAASSQNEDNLARLAATNTTCLLCAAATVLSSLSIIVCGAYSLAKDRFDLLSPPILGNDGIAIVFLASYASLVVYKAIEWWHVFCCAALCPLIFLWWALFVWADPTPQNLTGLDAGAVSLGLLQLVPMLFWLGRYVR